MTTLPYRIFEHEGEATISVFTPNGPRIASSTHPNFDAIVEAVQRGEDPIDLINGEQGVIKAFEKVTDRVSLKDGVFLFDNDPIHDALAETIVRFWQSGEADYAPLVAFFEKVQTNPNEHTRENLYRWLQNQSFHINAEGNIVGYKGVHRSNGYDPDDREAVEGRYVSVTGGPAIVDGQDHASGPVPNNPGSVIEMARSAVQHDPGVACSTGLHVGTWEYASNFGSVTLAVEVNPRDVVSVPTDCNGQKLRACRYTVIGEVTREHAKAAWDGVELPEEPTPTSFIIEDEVEYCDECAEPIENCWCDEEDWNDDDTSEDEGYAVTSHYPRPDDTDKKTPWWRRR